MIGQRSLPAHYGGVERAVEELGARLVDRGHKVDVFCWSADQPPALYRGMRLRRVPAVPGKHARALTQSVLATVLCLFGNYDVVHYHAMGPAIPSPLIRLRRRTKIVSTIQGRDDRRSKWNPVVQKLLRLGARTTAKVAHHTTVVSRQLQNDYREEFGVVTTYIPNGVGQPSDDASTDRVTEFGLTPNGYLLNVGRIVPEKGVDLIPAAVGAQKSPALPVVIVGSPAHTDSYYRDLEGSVGTQPLVRLLGEQRGDTLHQLFQNAAGFVFPSHLEGLPIVLLEAISYGIPLVCSDIDPVVQVIGETSRPGCRIFHDGDVDGFARALDEAASDDPIAVSAQVELLRKKVLDEFSWDLITTQVEAVYEALCA